MPNDNIRKVYDALSAKYNKMAQPYEEFEQMMTDEQNRKKVYDALSSKYSNMAQSWDEFNSMLAPAAAEQVEAKPVEQAQVNAAPEQKEGGNPAVMPEAQAEQEPAPQVDEKVDSIARSLIDNPTQRYVPSTPEEGAAVAQRLQEIKGEADAEREAAQQWAEDNKEMLDQTKQEMKEARRAKWQKLGEAILSTASPAPGMTATSAAVAGGASPSQQFNAERTQEAFKEYGENKLVADALDEALDYAHAAEKGASLGQGFIDMASRPGTWDFGYSDITKGLTLQALAEKWESGEPLSEQEEKVLDMVALATYITANTQEGVGIGYKVGESLPQSLGFMASLAINPASGLGRRMMQRAATKYGKVGMRALGDMLEMGVATVSSGGGRTLADAIDRINGSTQYEISPEGLVTYGGQAEQEELGRAALKAFGNNFIENYTEAMGEYFAPLAGMLGNLTDKGLRRVGLERFADFLNAVPQSQWGQMVRQFKDLTKFNGIVGEILEEEIGMFMEPLAIGDSTLGENFAVWSADPQIRDRARENQLTTILSCALMSGALYGVEAAGARTKFDKELRQADHNGEAEWGRRDWNDIKSALNQAGPEEMVRTMKDIVYNPELDEYERRAVVEYAAKLLQTQQFNTASEEAKQEMDEVSKELMAAYDAGYRMGIKSEPQSLRAVNLAFAKAIDDVEALGVRDLAYDLISADAATREQTLQGLGVQERNAVEYFLGCEKRHSGVYDGVEFAADTQYDDAMYSLAPAVRTDEQGGRTITSAVTADGRSVYVVGGEGAMSVIIDEEGNKVPYPADQLSDIVTSDAQKVEDELRAAIDEQWQGRLKFYEAHNEKTQEPQVGMVIGDGDQTVVVTDMGDGWATVQEAKTDDEGNIIPKPDGKSRDVTKEYLLSLQDEIYDRRDMMDGKMPADKADIIIGPSPENVAAMQQRAAQWEAATGQKVRLIDSLDQVDNTQARQAIENKQFITGWFNDATGEVCFYMPNMTDVKEIDKTFIHEVVGHKGMRMLLGERGYAALCDKVWNDLMTDEQKALYMSKVEHLQGDEVSRQQSAADEYIAYYAEQMNLSPDAVDQSVWERIVQIIKDILSSLGLGQEITNDELSELLRASLARFQEQNRIIQEEAARQQAEAEAQVQEESALSKIPAITDKEGKVVDYDWTKAPDLNTALEAMREAGYDEDIIKGYAEDMAKMLQDKAKKLEKSKPTESMATRQANKAKVLELTSQIDFWQNLANYFTERKEAEQEALDAFGSDFKDVDNAVGKIIDEMDFATQVRYAAAHAQYIWADNPNGTKGFASHMIAAKGNKRSERLANIGWLANRDKGGRYPEEIAHSIFANMPDALKEGHDEMEVLDIVLDAIKSANHPATVVRGMYQELIQKREDEERMRQEQEAEEEERQKDLWAQDHGFANFQDYITFEELQETGEDIIEIPADQLENYYNTLYGTDTEGSLEPGVQGVVQQPAGQDETDGGGNTLGQAEGTPEQGVGIRTAGTEAGTDNVLPGAEGQQTPGVIQGLEDYTEQEIKDEVSDYISQFGFTPEEFEIEGIRPVGSRVSGTAKEDSDLDVLVQYNGRMSEYALFNMLNNDEHPLYIDGIRVDINPIRPDKSGTIDEWLERNKDYKKEEQPKSKAQQAVEALEGEDEENDFPQETLTPVETIRVPDSNATSSDISLYNTVDGKWRYNMSAWSDKNTMSSPATSNMTFDSREAALKDAIEYAKWYRDKLDESGTPHKGLDEFIEYAEKQINNNPDGPTLFREGSIENLHKCERAISDWLKNDTRNKSIGVVLPLDVQAQVQKVMGRAFGDNIITANSVAHAKANHGINGKKNTESSIPLRDSDFALMPDVMVAPDKVERGSTDATNRESVRFIKNLSNGIVVVVEKEQKNSPDDMETITMWANKSSGVADARNASPAIDALDVISDNDVAKIKKDAEKAIERNTFFREANDQASLMGAHNITAENLKNILKRGGLANPSMAVVNTDNHIHTNYGEISLIPYANRLDASKYPGVVTYSGDAYTPNYPHIVHELTDKGEKKIEEMVKRIGQGNKEVERFVDNNLSNHVQDNGTHLTFEYAFEHRLNPEVIYEQPLYSKEDYDRLHAIIGDKYANELSKEEKQQVLDILIAAKQKEVDAKIKNIESKTSGEQKPWRAQYLKMLKSTVDDYRKNITDENGEIWFSTLDNYIFGVNEAERKRNNPRIDAYKTRDNALQKISAAGLNDDYWKWVENLFDEEEWPEKLFAGWTRDGYRRLIPNTLENASRLMNKEPENNAEDWHGYNATRSLMLKKMRTLSDIRKYKHLLVAEEDYHAQADKMSHEWTGLVSELSDMQKISDNPFSNVDYAEARIQEAMTKANPIAYLNKEYGYDIDKDGDFGKRLTDVIFAMESAPAKYFETKFSRPVYLNEFKTAIVPDNLDDDLRSGLQDAGINLVDYKHDDLEDRINKTRKATEGDSDVRFREANVNQVIFVSNAQRAIENIKQEKATPEQWLAMLQKAGGIKSGEDKWLGLSQWLKTMKDMGAKTLTKQEILDYIDANKIQIVEQKYAESPSDLDREIEEEYPGWNQAFYSEYYEGPGGNISWSINDLRKAVEIYNAANSKAVEIDIDEEGNITDDEYDEILDWAKKAWKEAPVSVRGINPFRLRYTTKDLDNKREIALTVPSIEPWNEEDDIHFGDAGSGRAIGWIRFGDWTGFKSIDKSIKENAAADYENYKTELSSKYGEDWNNKASEDELLQLNWLRLVKEGVAKTLVIDEIQSKRHQEGRKIGYKNDFNEAELEKARQESVGFGNALYNKYIKGQPERKGQDFLAYVTEEEREQWDEIQHRVSSLERVKYSGVPDAPFDKNWPELCMKRMLRLAAEEGYDKMAWTSGETQAERYNIGSVVDYITSRPYAAESKNEVDGFDVEVYPTDSNTPIMFFVRKDDGGINANDNETIDNKPLSDVIGKELADKILSSTEEIRLEGDALRLGAEGMQAFYDKMLPAFMTKYGKQWGVKAELQEIPGLDGKWWTVDVTPEMKQSVMEGQVMFRERRANEAMDVLLGDNAQGTLFTPEQMKGGVETAETEVVSKRKSEKKAGPKAERIIPPLRKLEPGETCLVQRQMTEDKNFNFTVGNKIETLDDIAYIFKELEDKAVENCFVVFFGGECKEAIVLHLSMGGLSSASVDMRNILPVLKAVKPGNVCLVHNHPSGNLIQSRQDNELINAFEQLVKTFAPDVIVEPGIIIDTKSGKYGIFGPGAWKTSGDMPQNAEGEHGLKVYNFDKVVFAPDFKPEGLGKIRTSRDIYDIAAFVSGQRLGEREKVSILCLNQTGGAIGNFFSDIATIENPEDGKRLADQCVEYAGACGGTAVVVYGTGIPDHRTATKEQDEAMRQFKIAMSKSEIAVLDAESIDKDYNGYYSYADHGVFEPETEYGQVRFRVSEGIEDRRDDESPREFTKRVQQDYRKKFNEVAPFVILDDKKLSKPELKVRLMVSPYANINKIYSIYEGLFDEDGNLSGVYGWNLNGLGINKTIIFAKENKDDADLVMTTMIHESVHAAFADTTPDERAKAAAAILKWSDKRYGTEPGENWIRDYYRKFKADKRVNEDNEIIAHVVGFDIVNEEDGVNVPQYIAEDESVADLFNGIISKIYKDDNRRRDSGDTESQTGVGEETAGEAGEDSEVRFREITDQALIDKLEAERKVKVYRAMQMIDGKLYPPMAAKVDGELVEPVELGKWEEAVERPDLADGEGYYKLDKGNGKSIKARYNPYIHTSRSPLNDQFTSAYDRPNLVTVEVEIPESELTSGYKAEGAKDAVGELSWHSGPVSGKLPKDKERKVILSRYDKPLRVVPDSEVAQEIAKLLEGENIPVPYNTVTPSLREELERAGVEISDKPSGNVKETPKNTSLDQVLFRIGVNHNSAYLLKKADGAFWDEQTGERLGFDTRFIGNGQGSISHGWGSYFSVKDIREYASNGNFDDDAEVTGKRYSKNDIWSAQSWIRRAGIEKALKEFNEGIDNAKAARPDNQGAQRVLAHYSKLKELVQAVRDGKVTLNQLSAIAGQHHYDVTIPENTGDNYLEEMSTLPKPQRRRIADAVRGLEGEPAQSVKYVGYRDGWNSLANMIEREPWAYKEIRDRVVEALGGTLDAERQLSELMSSIGYVGVHYDGHYDGECYVIFNPDDARIENHVMFREKPEELRQAEAQTDTKPTEGQKEAGNYRKGHIRLFGMDLSIENPEGSTRSGIDPDGKEWSQVMKNTYGYIRGTMGRDKDHIDFFLGPDLSSDKVYVVDQKDVKTGKFDEHKVMLGFDDMEDARDAYNSNYDEGWDGLGAITEMSLDDFKEWAMQEGRRVQPVSDVRFRERDEKEYERIEKNLGIAAARYERAMDDTGKRLTEVMQDSMKSVDELQKAVTEADGKPLRDYENAYWAAIQYSSRNKAMQDNYQTHFFRPLMEAVADILRGEGDREAAWDELNAYLLAKHGLERNEVFARRDAKKEYEEYIAQHPNGKATEDDFYNQNRRKDYSGITALMQEKNVANAEGLAQALVDNYEKNHDATELWKRINAATKETLRTSYGGGIISEDKYKELLDMFEYYVPLRGFDETTSDDVYGYYGTVNSPYNTAIKTAKGRRSLADSPLATIGNIADSEIMRANRNRIYMAALALAEGHKNPLMSVSEVMYQRNPQTGMWELALPQLNENDSPEQVAQKMSQFRTWFAQQMLTDPDNYRTQKELERVPYKVISKSALSEHQILATRGGKQYIITINGNPRAAQALTGKTNADSNLMLPGMVSELSRWISRTRTQWNVGFVLRNLCRDAIFANINVRITESPAYANKYNKNWGKVALNMASLLHKYNKGTLDDNVPMERYFKEFIDNGGETGYTKLLSVKDYKKVMEKEIKRLTESNPAPKRLMDGTLKIIGGAVENMNRWAEGITRFTAFLTSREQGRSLTRSVEDAKEISVNFNKKGAGTAALTDKDREDKALAVAAAASQIGREGYSFFNANVQGLAKFIGNIIDHPGKGSALIGSLLVAGFVMGMMNGGDGDDDDEKEYYNLPEYIRRSCLCIKVGKHWLTLPLPPEYTALYGLGELLHSSMSGAEYYEPDELAYEILSQFSQLLPLDLLEGRGSGAWQNFVPTGLRTLVENKTNLNWMGQPIYNDSQFNQDDPAWRKAYRGTSPALVNTFRKLSDWTGGNVGKPGWLNLNPATWEHFFEGYFGGIFSEPAKVIKAIRAIAGDEEMQDVRNYPIISGFMRDTSNIAGVKAENSRWHKINDFVEEIENEDRRLRQMVAEKTITGFDYDDKDIKKAEKRLEELRSSGDWDFAQQWKAMSKGRDKARQGKDEEEFNRLTKEMNDVYKEFRKRQRKGE